MLQLIVGAAILAAIFYYVCVKPMYYWRVRGVKQENQVWVFGNNWSTTIGSESFMDMLLRVYKQFPGTRYHGVYQFTKPTLLVKDPELLKQITVKDFEHFTDHRTILPEEVDPLWGKKLFALTGMKTMLGVLYPMFCDTVIYCQEWPLLI